MIKFKKKFKMKLASTTLSLTVSGKKNQDLSDEKIGAHTNACNVPTLNNAMCQHVHGLHNPVYQYFQMPNAIKLLLDSSLQLMFRMFHARVCYQNTVQSSGYYTILLPNLVAVWG